MFINKLKIIPKCQYLSCDDSCRFLTYSQGFSKGCCHNHAIKIGNLVKFGVEKPFQSKEIQKKIKKTINTKYGVSCIPLSTQFKTTMLKRYNVEHPMKSVEIKNKRIDLNMEKYGVSHPMKTKEIKDKVLQTTYNRYGIKSFILELNEKNMINKERWDDRKFIQNNFIIDGYIDENAIKNYFNCSIENGNILKHFRNLDIPFKCRKFESKYEEAILNCLIEINSEIIIVKNDRELLNGLEIDIYLPEFKLGIEINGIYWHSNKFKKDEYHYLKSTLAQEKKIRLLHIFDIEIKNNLILLKQILRYELQYDAIQADLDNFIIKKSHNTILSDSMNYVVSDINHNEIIHFGLKNDILIIHYSFINLKIMIKFLEKIFAHNHILLNRRFFNLIEYNIYCKFNKITLKPFLDDLYSTDCGYLILKP